MSGEFGDYLGGYFHNKIQSAAEDAAHGRDPLTKLWGKFLEEFEDIARAISYSEACDSGPHDTIFNTLQRLPELKRRLETIESFVYTYKRVAEDAVEKAVKEHADKNKQ